MHKKILLTALLLFISAVANAQTEEKMGYIGLTYGPSFPVGVFGSKGLTESDAGIANNGHLLEGTMAYRMGKYLGLEICGYLQSNPVDVEAMLEQYSRAYPDITWTGASSSSWKSSGFMGGVFGLFPFAKGYSSLELKALIGYMTTSTPDLSITGSQGGISATASQTSVSIGGAGVLLGASYKYYLGSSVALMANLSYYAATPKYEDVKSTLYVLAYPVAYSYNSFEQPVKTINLTFGLAIRLD